MTKEINNYISEFESIYNGEPRYGKSLMAVIQTGDAKNVFKKARLSDGQEKPAAHSAYEVVHHLYAWRDLLVKRLNGDTTSSIETDSKEDWTPLPKEKNATAWKALIKKLEQNQAALVKALAKWDDEALDKNFAGTNYPLRTFLNGQIQHDIYHIGQIALAIKNA